ncbi:hypothetical protein J6590_005261 [Homalodisca vitripennis]|nr:hypothetical protein J6590_005261 [Homalodisca vitripennis]
MVVALCYIIETQLIGVSFLRNTNAQEGRYAIHGVVDEIIRQTRGCNDVIANVFLCPPHLQVDGGTTSTVVIKLRQQTLVRRQTAIKRSRKFVKVNDTRFAIKCGGRQNVEGENSYAENTSSWDKYCIENKEDEKEEEMMKDNYED